MTELAESPRRVRDPLHGLIVFGDSGDTHRDDTDRIAWNLLNTSELQRLRRIRQLGFSDLVFPGATHSRFSHSVGTYHMARRLADVIAKRRPGGRDKDRERVALLAALLHDVGHGPFSHVFESVARSLGHDRSHEAWGAVIIEGDTQVNSALRAADEQLPERIAALLAGDHQSKDIYGAIVSSQFDADRLDYIQRDRLMTGVGFGHIDLDWLLDCLDVGTITIGADKPSVADCIYLGPKGVQVAEEYLEARYRLYRMVYVHKTTRAAEAMLKQLLIEAVSTLGHTDAARGDAVLRFLTSASTSVADYLALDDNTIWSTIATYSELGHARISGLASRLLHRRPYKCLDVGDHDVSGGNLYRRFRRKVEDCDLEWRDEILFDDDATTTFYKWHEYEDGRALEKMLVKTDKAMREPEDIAVTSKIVQALRGKERIQRCYVPDAAKVEALRGLLEEAK